LFNGRDLSGWKASENSTSFHVDEGAIVADGPRSHLFYAGSVSGAEFRNFQLRAEVMSMPRANSGIYFHTRFQDSGFPAQGFEVQVNNTAEGAGNYRERKKTGSLYGVRNTYKTFVRDREWFPIHLNVRGKRVQVAVDGMLLVDYIEPETPYLANERGRRLGSGTIALQCHDPGSKVRFRNIAVRPLAHDISSDAPAPLVDDLYRKVIDLGARNFPLVDYHVHLKGDLSANEAVAEARRLGFQYGIAANCGRLFPITDDAGIYRYIDSLKGQPVFIGMQAEGREWTTMFSPEAIAKFDYVFTDAMTFTDNRGRRMRTWIAEEVGAIEDAEQYAEMLTDRIVTILSTEPIDIYANPLYLPDAISPRAEELWTERRMSRIIEAARIHEVAIELNNRYRLPQTAFIKLAKQASLRFAFGTNNTGKELGRNEYALEMVESAGLQWRDIFIPKAEGDRPVQRRKTA
jgi:histidinol phosphatase-like PHP family hydrolase